MRKLNRWFLVAVPLLLVSVLLCWYLPQPREAMYSLYRDRSRAETLSALSGYRTKESDHYEIWYTDADANIVDLILKTAESVYTPVTRAVGFQGEKVPLIVYPDRTELRNAFGWGNSESALGVYYQGTIRLLSPNAWMGPVGNQAKTKAFLQLNPIAHELTHYLLDYRTEGNYPHWFTEGLAQRVEHNVTGYLWIEAESTLRQNLYTLDDLQNRFDQLQNQPLAYRESFLLVDYLANTYGEEKLSALLNRLSAGVSFDKAVQVTLGRSIEQFYAEWADWVKQNLNELDPIK